MATCLIGRNHNGLRRSRTLSARLLLVAVAVGCAEPPSPETVPGAEAQPADQTGVGTEASIEGSERVWEDARERGVAFRAVGQEPGWLLEIEQTGAITLLTAYGSDTTRASVPAEDVVLATGATTYSVNTDAGEPLRISIRTEPCTDTMSGEQFSRTVAVVLVETEYHGCGRALSAVP